MLIVCFIYSILFGLYIIIPLLAQNTGKYIFVNCPTNQVINLYHVHYIVLNQISI